MTSRPQPLKRASDRSVRSKAIPSSLLEFTSQMLVQPRRIELLLCSKEGLGRQSLARLREQLLFRRSFYCAIRKKRPTRVVAGKTRASLGYVTHTYMILFGKVCVNGIDIVGGGFSLPIQSRQ